MLLYAIRKERRFHMAKNKNQNRANNKSGKNAKNTVKNQNNSKNSVKPDDIPRRDGPGGN